MISVSERGRPERAVMFIKVVFELVIFCIFEFIERHFTGMSEVDMNQSDLTILQSAIGMNPITVRFDVNPSYELRAMIFDPWIGEGTGRIKVTDVDTNFHIRLHIINYTTELTFQYARRNYIFRISKWSGTAVNRYLHLFHRSDFARDANIYGALDVDDIHTGTPQQRRNCVLRSSIDILICLGKILLEHQRMVLDYAVWYLNRRGHAGDEPYEAYITAIVCRNIIDTEFTAGNVMFKVVEL